MLHVPDVVREKALAVGAAGWLDDLPELVRELERDWHIEVGEAFPFSTEAFVAEVACADGTPAVLKLIVPRDGDAAAREVAALRLADGDGCARLLRDDVERGALLLERSVDRSWSSGCRCGPARDPRRHGAAGVAAGA